MATNDYDHPNEGIDPLWLTQEQDQLGQTGTWVGPLPVDPIPVHDPRVFLESIEVGGFPEALDIPSWQGLQYPRANIDFTQRLLGDRETALAAQPSTPVRSFLRPEAANFVPQGLQRPQLQLATSGLEAFPTTTGSFTGSVREAPLSAPAIRVIEPDDVLAEHVYMQACQQIPRRRANSAPRTMLGQYGRHATAPASPTGASDGHLSPIHLWMSSAAPRVLAQVTSPPATQAQVTSRPPTPSRSRSSSVSSVRSSAGGSHVCDHCTKSYSTKSKLDHHRRCHTPYHMRSYVCDLCEDARFIFRKDLKRHKASHSEYHFHCSQCGKSFSRADHLSRHKNGHSARGGASSPTTTSVTQPSPWTVGSSFAGSEVPGQAAYNDNDLGTPFTDFNTSPFYDPTLLPMPDDDPRGMEWDFSAQVEAQSPPSPSPMPRFRSDL